MLLVGVGPKRSLQWLRKYFDQNDLQFDPLWEGIKDIIIKTLLTVQPELSHLYNSEYNIGTTPVYHLIFLELNALNYWDLIF